jgi:hypothetical protein
MILKIYLILLFLVEFSIEINNLGDFDCDISDDPLALNAYSKVKSEKCKTEIKSAACYYKIVNSLDATLKYKRLQSKCPKSIENKGKLIDCLTHIELEKLITENKYSHEAHFNNPSLYNKDVCVDYCLAYYRHKYALYNKQNQTDGSVIHNCVCFFDLPSFDTTDLKIESCDGTINNTIYQVHTTGIQCNYCKSNQKNFESNFFVLF